MPRHLIDPVSRDVLGGVFAVEGRRHLLKDLNKHLGSVVELRLEGLVRVTTSGWGKWLRIAAEPGCKVVVCRQGKHNTITIIPPKGT